MHPMLLNWCTHGRALPLAWVTVRKDQLQGRMRQIEGDLLKRVVRLWPRSCHPILLADRGFGTRDLFDLLDGLHWDWIIRSKGTTHVEIHPGVWVPLRALATQPVLRDLSVRYGQSYGDQAYPAGWGSGPKRAIPTPGF